MSVVMHTIEVPMVPAPPPGCTEAVRREYLPGNIGTHLEMQMNAAEAEVCHRLYEALVQQRATVGEGQRTVQYRADVVRWMFERLAEDASRVKTPAEAGSGASTRKGPAKAGAGGNRAGGVRAR